MKKQISFTLTILLLLIISIDYAIASKKIRQEKYFSLETYLMKGFNEKILVIGGGLNFENRYPENVYLINKLGDVNADLVIDISERDIIKKRGLEGKFNAVIWEDVDKKLLVNSNVLDNIMTSLVSGGRLYLSLNVLYLAEKSGGIKKKDPAGGDLKALDKGVYYYSPIHKVSGNPFICYYDNTSIVYELFEILKKSGDDLDFQKFNEERNRIFSIYDEKIFRPWLQSLGFERIVLTSTKKLLWQHWFKESFEDYDDAYSDLHLICYKK